MYFRKFGALALVLIACSSTPRHIAQKPPTAPTCQLCEEALTREEKGYHDQRFSEWIEALAANHPAPDSDNDYKIDEHMLLTAVKAIVARDHDLRKSASLANHDGMAVPLEIFLSLRRQLKAIFGKEFELTEDEADAMAENIQKEALAAAKISESEFSKATGIAFLEDRELTNLARFAAEKLHASSEFEKKFDVPYIAGYAADNPRLIFIDRHVPEKGEAGGKPVPAHFLLNVHERVEKILLDRLGLTYQHAHQIAQRAERRAAKAFGLRWNVYDAWMEKATEAVGENRPLKIHPGLDMTCYYSYTDPENLSLLALMEESRKSQP